jgi:putative flippase GtrA
VASAAGLAVDFSLYVGLTELASWHYLASAAAGFIAGATAVYAFSVAWVFSERRFGSPGWEFAVFAGIGVLGLLVTEIALYVCTDVSGLDYRLSKVFAAGTVFLLNFGLRRTILFTRSAA